MSLYRTYRREPRGRPAIGFQLEAAREMELRDASVFACREVRQDGRTIGEIEIRVFGAALIIDRDGILEEQACAAIRQLGVSAGATAIAVNLPGAGGFRTTGVVSGPLPYLHVFALAAYDLGVDGGLLVTLRCASPDWAAADHILRSLRIITRSGLAAIHEDSDDAPILPVVAPRR